MHFSKDQIIFKQGEIGDVAYLIEKGKVEVFYKDNNSEEVSLALLGEGELFGEMSLISTMVRTASTRAFSDCELLAIKKDQLFERVNASDKIVQLILRILIKRLQNKNVNLAANDMNIANSAVEASINQIQNNQLAIERLKFENELNEAFLKNEFTIHHQPIICLSENKIVGSEALIRWNSPKKGMISPGAFVDILENSSMIIPIGFWIIEQCFVDYNQIKAETKNQNFEISINISGRQFLHYSFIDTLKQLIKKHDIDATKFKLEITERILMDGEGVVDILKQCSDLGFQISLDDFGTGFSSLQYLAKMPIDVLKIDRSFTMNSLSDDKIRAVISSIIFLAKKLNLKIIAEGIESMVEANTMKELGCDFGQGYFFSKPVDLTTLKKLVNKSPAA